MIIKNPTDKEVRIVINGNEHKIAPDSTKTVEDAIGAEWVRIHQFLSVEGGSVEDSPAEEEKVEEPTEDVVEPEEKEEEKPKRKSSKK